MRLMAAALALGVSGCSQTASAPELADTDVQTETVAAYVFERWHFHEDADGLKEDRESFLDNRMDLRVTKPDGRVMIVPGYLGLSETEIDGQLSWHAEVEFDQSGRFEVETFTCRGERVALGSSICDGPARRRVFVDVRKRNDGMSGSGRVTQSETRYLQRGDGSIFLKTGAGSPENILAYADFDGTYDLGGTQFPGLGDDQLHAFAAHVDDWREGDPTWGDGKGKGLVGLFNYYAEAGVNSQYLVAMNVEGDGQDVFPWVSPEDPYVFDISKLAQWQTVLEHANDRGVLIDFLLTETENESWFEAHDGVAIGRDFADSRKLYYREMVARFGHLPMLVWNLGEEIGVEGDTGQRPYRLPVSMEQRKAFSDHIAALDAYDHPIVSHSYPYAVEESYAGLLGHLTYSGLSLQAHEGYFDQPAEWIRRSAEAGRQWMVALDEPLGWEYGARPDADASDPRPEIINVLWPALLGGATGVNWYFGWQNNAPTSDLSNEDQRSRDRLFRSSAKVRAFFETLPLAEMLPRREGDAMILEGAGYRLEMKNGAVIFSEPGQPARNLDPYNPE